MAEKSHTSFYFFNGFETVKEHRKGALGGPSLLAGCYEEACRNTGLQGQ